MATTYLSDKAAASVPIRTPVVGGTATVRASFTITAALVVNDVIQLVKVPKGCFVLDVKVQCPDLDTGGSPVAAFTVGDGGDTDRYITATTAGAAATLTRMNALTALATTSPYTADDTVDLLISTAPQTSVTTGTIVADVTYALQT